MRFCDCSVNLLLVDLTSVQMGWVFFHYRLLPKVLILSVAFAFLNTLAALIDSRIFCSYPIWMEYSIQSESLPTVNTDSSHLLSSQGIPVLPVVAPAVSSYPTSGVICPTSLAGRANPDLGFSLDFCWKVNDVRNRIPSSSAVKWWRLTTRPWHVISLRCRKHKYLLWSQLSLSS